MVCLCVDRGVRSFFFSGAIEEGVGPEEIAKDFHLTRLFWHCVHQ